MGQYFKIINQTKKQYLEPFDMPSSERFPTLIQNDFMCRMVTWLVCRSENQAYLRAQNKGFYSQRFMGAWYGDAVDVVGDYDEEDLCYTAKQTYENITTKVMAMALENDQYLLDEFVAQAKTDTRHFLLLAEMGMLEPCSDAVNQQLNVHFGSDWQWKSKYYEVKNCL